MRAAFLKSWGGEVVSDPATVLPTLVVGDPPAAALPAFCVRMSWEAWQFAITPVADGGGLACAIDNPLAGVGAAALGVNEAFLHIRRDSPEAGFRSVGFSLWDPMAVAGWRDGAAKGPALTYLPDALWLVGLGHLGQAYAWSLGMLPYPGGKRPHLVLQDFDKAAKSNLSTCMLLSARDLGQRKVRVVAQRLEAVGFTTDLVERRFGPDHRVFDGEPTTALFGVDNVAARRDLDGAGFSFVVEAGLGSGYRDFRNIRTHTFPGPRRPSEIWTADATVQARVELNDVYQRLAQQRDDICGMTLLASRAVATPFVGSLAAALVLSEVMRPLHGGGVYATLDLQMKDLRHRAGAKECRFQGLPPSYVEANSERGAEIEEPLK